MDCTGSALAWFAIQVRPRYEKIVAAVLTNKGYETFLPMYRSRRRWSDRVKEIQAPLFPGYLFSRFDVAKRLPILTTPGILMVVGNGKTPVPVSEEEIAAVRAIVDSEYAARPWPFLPSGHPVEIERGSLAGLRGILVSARKQHRLVVSVSLLQRSVAVEINPDCVRPLEPPRGMPVQDAPVARAARTA